MFTTLFSGFAIKSFSAFSMKASRSVAILSILSTVSAEGLREEVIAGQYIFFDPESKWAKYWRFLKDDAIKLHE